MSLQILKKCPLFAQIDFTKIDSLLTSLHSKTQTYQKDEFVFQMDDKASDVGIVLSGAVNVLQEDFWGNDTIIAHIEPGNLFGEAFSCARVEQLPVSVRATQTSEVLLLNYRIIIEGGSNVSVYQTQLISNMLQILANKNIVLTQKIRCISQRTIREKLLSFLSMQSVKQKSNEIKIPYNRQELADFLCVERSALSRELGIMKKEGLLEYKKNQFVLNTVTY